MMPSNHRERGAIVEDILALANNYRSWTRNFEYAAALARDCSGSLTGVFVSEPIVPLQPMSAPLAFPEMYTITGDIAREARAAETGFLDWASEHGAPNPQWVVAEGYLAQALAHAANWHDLLVLEAGGESPLGSAASLGQILLTCGLPCIVVPQSGGTGAKLDTIAIAWKGTAESVRAMHAALPLLRRARRIVLIHGDSPQAFSSIDWKPPLDVDGYLARHGLEVSNRVLQADGDDAGAELQRRAIAENADLLVMGAYGRSRFSEWILGGATRHVLEHAQLPVFMRH
jgi:nucleotide-binding universal stress UspA family protein